MEANLPGKNAEFRARKCFHVYSRAAELLHFLTTLMMDVWHDDVVDMMMEMLTMTIIRKLEVC